MQVNELEATGRYANLKTSKHSQVNGNLGFLSALRQQVEQASVNHHDSSTKLDVQENRQIPNSVQVPTIPKKVSQSVIIDGEEWNDERLAGCIDVWGNISTEKTINWNATGTDVLTQTQMADLRERYDIENMSKQDFYDLLSDLTHLNVVSAHDCESLFWVHAPDCMAAPSELYHNYNQRHLELNYFTRENSNLLQFMQLRYEHSLEMFNWVGSRSFDEYNPSMPPLIKQRYVDALSSETASYQKFFSIFQSIKR